VIAAWDDTLAQITSSDAFKELMARIKTEGAYLNSADFTATIMKDYEAMGKAVAEFGIGAE
jgi:tripartite-type tricarboxylate transporter receptor subunit TctC